MSQPLVEGTLLPWRGGSPAHQARHPLHRPWEKAWARAKRFRLADSGCGVRDGLTYPAMIMEGGLPNFFTINGKAYPATETIDMKVGQTLKLRFIGSNNNFVHPMYVHGGPFEVVARDGEIVKPSARFLADTVNVGPGQRYDVIWTAREPGKWLLHCHIPHHTVNNNVEEEGGGGLMMVINVTS